METRFQKTRLAPTPSGYLHLGNILSFIITAELARRYGARILLRIDDLDQERVRPGYVQDIFDSLDFMGIEWQEGPRNFSEFSKTYSQLHRVPLYEKTLDELRERARLFACGCSRSQQVQSYQGTCLKAGHALNKEGMSWRIDTSAAQAINLNTYGGSYQVGLPGSVQYFMVRRKNGAAAYQLASLADDMYFGTDLIVRGADLLPSTLAQLLMAKQLGETGFNGVHFVHHALLNDPGGEKLSKSEGAQSLRYWRRQHKKPSDIYKMLAEGMGLKGEPHSGAELVQMLELQQPQKFNIRVSEQG